MNYGSMTANRENRNTENPLLSFDGLLDLIQEKYTGRTAFSFADGSGRRTVSYETFCQDVRRAARRFTRTGIPVALLGETRYDWIVLYFAIVTSGNIVIPLDNTANIETLLSELDNAGCSNLFFTERYRSLVRSSGTAANGPSPSCRRRSGMKKLSRCSTRTLRRKPPG